MNEHNPFEGMTINEYGYLEPIPEPTHCARCGEAYADHWGGCELVCPRDVPYADKHKYYPDEYPALTGKPYTPTYPTPWDVDLIHVDEEITVSTDNGDCPECGHRDCDVCTTRLY